MVYAVDITLKLMEGLSQSRPHLFQRDGSLFVVSQEGLGVVSFGLSTYPIREPRYGENQLPEILESKNAILGRVKEGYETRLRLLEGEQPHLEAIAFGTDSTLFSLKDIVETARELSEIPDDGNIRLVSHDTRYHSHKYGYASDGIDVWVHAARVMNRERYLELLRKKEEEIMQGIANFSVEDRRDLSGVYTRLKFPDCVVLTPHFVVSFPRAGSRNSSWTSTTEFSIDNRTKGSVLYHNDVDTMQESPFGVMVITRPHGLMIRNDDEARDAKKSLVDCVERELNVVSSNISQLNEFTGRLNEMHNRICAKDIEWYKELKKDSKSEPVAAR